MTKTSGYLRRVPEGQALYIFWKKKAFRAKGLSLKNGGGAGIRTLGGR